jgi:nucleoside-diphosphate-sugar epimerase
MTMVTSLKQSKPLKILVLGGTGFVGRTVIEKANAKGYEAVSISRRGRLPTETDSSGKNVWFKGDITDKSVLTEVINKYGPFNAYVHTAGLLFDAESGLKSFNKLASGSGSVPGELSTYDRITKQTVFDSLDIINKQRRGSNKTPFLFISAAETRWEFEVPVAFLRSYLIAKKAAEQALLSSSAVRPVIFRPSLIWTPRKPLGLLSVIPFYVGFKLGVPILDRPVNVDSLSEALVEAIAREDVSGVKNYADIDSLAQQYNKPLV